ncbi:adenylate/guanylate cyclase domain-containing protein [Ectothiorhodospiraceae bacterium BW-2]|nr:adenylate/guanylate cyclase domain-containing protein [Ectothiorhodospiraceae bacterium BW-2]
MRQLFKQRPLATTTIITALFGLTLLLDISGALNRLEYITFDLRTLYHQQQSEAHPDIVVIMIDEASLQTMNPLVGRFPWPRALYGDLIDYLVMGGAKAIIFDILFTENQQIINESLSSDDARLAAATASSGITYHALQFIREELEGQDQHTLHHPLPQDLVAQHAFAYQGFSDRGNNSALYPYPELYQAAKGLGIVEVEPDADGIYRRIRPFHLYQGNLFASLGLAPLIPTNTVVIKQSQRIGLNSSLPPLPLDRDGRVMIKQLKKVTAYSAGGVFASIQQLYQGKLDQIKVMPDQFAGKYVFIGASAIGLQDLKATPLSPKTPGVMLHVSLLSNLLQDSLLHHLPVGATYLISLLFIIVTLAAVLLQQRMAGRTLLPLMLISLWGALGLLLFAYHWVVNITTPIIAILLTFFSSFAYLSFSEIRERQRVRATFGRYLSPAALNQILDDEQLRQEITLSNREQLTIFFSDIRSFTSISESLPAQRVVELLNTYFGVMAEIAYSHKGTLDKYIGDAIMAFWGAPLQIEHHATECVSAALKMEQALIQVNQTLLDKGLPTIDVGMGIHTGEAILGNIGSEHKLDYTIIGDSVNLASRLEGLTKPYHCRIIISETTYLALSCFIPCAVIDMVRVKGKAHPIMIFAPLCPPDSDSETLNRATAIATHSHLCFKLYLEQQWQAAIEAYQQLPLPAYSQLMQERCHTFLQNPPEEGWDGVYNLTSK